jgi:hypothetical protein
MFSFIVHFENSKIPSTISDTDHGWTIFTFHRTTSGIGPTNVVNNGLPDATVSVWTDPNHSDNDGATTRSALATTVRNCS